MDGTFVIERPCNAYYFLEKARRVRLRLDPRLGCRALIPQKCCSRLCGFHVRRSINPPQPPARDSLKRFHRSHDQNTHRTHNKLTHPTCPTTAAAATMSPWTTPWESAFHLRANSRKSLVADTSIERTRTTSSTRTTSWSKISMDRTATAEQMATWTTTWTTLSRAAT